VKGFTAISLVRVPSSFVSSRGSSRAAIAPDVFITRFARNAVQDKRRPARDPNHISSVPASGVMNTSCTISSAAQALPVHPQGKPVQRSLMPAIERGERFLIGPSRHGAATRSSLSCSGILILPGTGVCSGTLSCASYIVPGCVGKSSRTPRSIAPRKSPLPLHKAKVMYCWTVVRFAAACQAGVGDNTASGGGRSPAARNIFACDTCDLRRGAPAVAKVRTQVISGPGKSHSFFQRPAPAARRALPFPPFPGSFWPAANPDCPATS